MSTGKKILLPFVMVDNVTLDQSFSSQPVSIQYMDRCCIEIVCTGTPTGTVTLQGSTDYVPNVSPSTANWFDISLNLVALAGSAQNYVIDMLETSIPWIRVNFAYSSGTGNMVATVTAKES